MEMRWVFYIPSMIDNTPRNAAKGDTRKMKQQITEVYNSLNETQRAQHNAGVIPEAILAQFQFRPKTAEGHAALAYHHRKTAAHGQSKSAKRTALSAEARHVETVSNLRAQSMKDARDQETAERRKRETELAKHAGARAKFKADIEAIQKLTADAEADVAEATTRTDNSILAAYAAMDHGEKRREFWDKNKRAILAAVDNNNAN
jgi:hypothetical protein